MYTVDIIHDSNTSFSQDSIRKILERSNIIVKNITTGDPLEITNADHTCIHVLSSSYGLRTAERDNLESQLSHRFIAAEIALTAQNMFVQILIGLHDGTIHIFTPYNETILANIGLLCNQMPSSQTTSSITSPSVISTTRKQQPTFGIEVENITSETPSKPESSSWEDIITSLHGSIDQETWADITPELKKPAPVRNILEQAGTRKHVRFDNGTTYTLYGYPNLTQANAKIILIGTQNGHIEIIPLHRAPQKIGVVSPFGCGWLPKADIITLAQERTGRNPPKTDVTLFALDSRALYYESAGSVYYWDGKKEQNFGSPNQALASLLLQWSQR